MEELTTTVQANADASVRAPDLAKDAQAAAAVGGKIAGSRCGMDPRATLRRIPRASRPTDSSAMLHMETRTRSSRKICH
ncbi:hypothetical protein PQR75_37140 [Paraburkholderia fungorum]|jgi:hypothetical protein